MKVYCTKIISPTTREQIASSSWVQVGKEYAVISILAGPDRSPQLQILTDDGTPSWWDAEMFHTASSTIPSRWILTVHEGGLLELGPPALLEAGFWEAYFNQDEQAVATFEEEKSRTLAELE